MRLVHISDPHLTDLAEVPRRRFRGKRRLGYLSWHHRRRHHHRRENLDLLCTAVMELAPDLIVVTGDLTQVGTPEELAAAGAWLRDLGPPRKVLVIPGNHDLYAADSWAPCYEHWRAYLHFAPSAAAEEAREPRWWMRFPSYWRADGLGVYGLNSGIPTSLGSAAGALGVAQQQRLADLLAAAPVEAMKMVVVHHPPLLGTMPKRLALRDARDLQALLDQTHLVLHGHGHWNRSYSIGTTQIFATGSASTDHAPFRLFEVKPATAGFEVRMELRVKDGVDFRLAESAEFIVSTK